jgi:hypothetical protein
MFRALIELFIFQVKHQNLMFRVLIELFIFQVRHQNLMFRALIELFIFQVRHQNLMFRALGAIEVVEVVAVDEVMSVGINTEGARQHLKLHLNLYTDQWLITLPQGLLN